MKNLIIIFTRNPELGKVKTRLAASIGNENTLEIYNYLLNHTKNVVLNVKADRFVFYTETINKNDIWDNNLFEKKLQNGNDLGEKMKNAFEEGFSAGYKKVVIVGSDLFDLEASDIETAFTALENNQVVIGPAEDGGYYLLGLTKMINSVFENKKWSTETVFQDTINDIKHLKNSLLQTKNDIDTIDDIREIEVFQKFIKT